MTARRRVLVAAGVVTVALVTAALAIGPGPILARGGFAAADERLVTGILVAGTAADPVLYVASSDPRIGSGLSGEDLPLDTNSGVVSRLRRSGDGWRREDLVRGLPRSEENHATNGLALDVRAQRLYVAQGAMTNMGAPSARFAYTPEYELAGSILEIQLKSLEPPYDLPTRRGDGPFGGAAGANQATLERGGPVSLHATGFRNPYDLVRTRRGRIYTVDNGPAYYWGGPPRLRGGRCIAAPAEFGRYGADFLYSVDRGLYAGHPNPQRAGECAYTRGERALGSFATSTNGLTEYTSTLGGGTVTGDLLAASIDGRLYRIDLDDAGDVRGIQPFVAVPGFPLDVVAQPDEAPFAGVIFVADYVSGDIVIYEPHDRRRAPHWQALASSRVARQEVSYVRLGDRFYLAGGGREHEVYDPATDTWSSAAPLPARLDHIQGVALDGRIYYVGGLEAFPEPASAAVFVYEAGSDTFETAAPMPRPRGGGGVAAHDGRIYYLGGLHEGEAVAWVDVYDPETNTWRALPDMPRPRDHFQAHVVGNRLYAIGGRDTGVDAFVAETDALDLRTGRWQTGLAPIPTPRGGYGSAVVAGEIVVVGGEATDRVFSEAEAYDPRTNTWRALQPMAAPRHGIQAVACGGDVYVAAGGAAPFGDEPTTTHTVYVEPSNRCPLARGRDAPPPKRGFRRAVLDAQLTSPTSIQVGPDARLYAAEQSGSIHALSFLRRLDGAYVVAARDRIDEVRELENHDDDGSKAADWRALVRFAAAKTGLCCEFPVVAPPVARGAATRPADPRRGEAIFDRAGCGGCHTFAPARSVAYSGPALNHLLGLPPRYVRTGIVEPNATIVPGYFPGRMPDDYGLSLDEQQLADLIAFLRRRP